MNVQKLTAWPDSMLMISARIIPCWNLSKNRQTVFSIQVHEVRVARPSNNSNELDRDWETTSFRQPRLDLRIKSWLQLPNSMIL